MRTKLHCYYRMGTAVLCGLIAAVSSATEPGPVAGAWERVGQLNFLVRDPLTQQPAALASDPSWRLSPSGAGILHGPYNASPPGLPVLNTRDVSPEFWAEPVAWDYFGPAAYSGFGRDADSREFAGRLAFDRRAYALDPGWRLHETLAPPTSTGAGTIQFAITRGNVGLQWRAQPGRVYVIEFTSSIGRPFTAVRTIESLAGEDISVSLPQETGHGFYRIAEQVY